jgi:hypothetical protein
MALIICQFKEPKNTFKITKLTLEEWMIHILSYNLLMSINVSLH